MKSGKQTARAGPANDSGPRLGLGMIISRLLPFGKRDESRIQALSGLFSKAEVDELGYLIKSRKARFSTNGLNVSKSLLDAPDYLLLAPNLTDARTLSRIEHYNGRLLSAARDAAFEKFSAVAGERILALIAPNIVGRESLKLAALLQLFASEKVHVLLLGDPSTGKTVVLRSVAELAPISSFGLGSGASKAGLTVMVSGKEVVKGILPLADGGIACIDELNLMKSQDLAGLLNAMEKGFITYDKGNSHLRIDSRVRVFASANPVGDKFVGKTVQALRKQIPFNNALLSRFSLVFLIRRPDVDEFLKISQKIISGGRDKPAGEADLAFIRDYISHALSLEVKFDQALGARIQEFVRQIKKDEAQFLVGISPRTVAGIVNLAKASARMRLSGSASREDVEKAISLVRDSLYLKKSDLDS